jgi:hypothetical protein
MPKVSPASAAFLLLCANFVPPLALAGGPTSPVGDARLRSGLAAHYEYHYDRNALRDSRRAGDALIALTRAGNLLRFDARTLKLAGESFGPEWRRVSVRARGTPCSSASRMAASAGSTRRP